MNCAKTSPGDSSTQMEGISINDLPLEVLAHIVSFLSPSERRKSTLISRRFAEAFNASFINDVWLKVIRNPADEAEAVICKSNRQYKNVRLCRVYPLKFNSVIWTKLGMSLRKLEVINCWYLSSRKIYSILLACPRLESLAFHGSCRAFKGQHFELPSEMNLRDIQEATRNLRHLHLAFLVNTNTLERMLVAMPNLLSIAIDLFPFKYEPKSLTRLPEIMGESRGIRTADWKHDIDVETKMGQFLRIASTSLQEFRAQLFCSRIPARKEGEKLKLCTTLCHLEIGLDETMDNLLLEHILRNTPDLEVLKLFKRCGLTIRLTHEVIVPILELTKLRELRLDLTLKQRPHSRVSKDFVRDLGKLSSLESLHLSQGFGTVDHSGFQSLANLPNLRELSLENLRWDDKCFEAFLSGFESLRRLSIDTNILSRNFGVPRRSESEQNIIDSAIRSESHRSGKRIKSSCLEYLELTVMPLTDVDLTRIVSHHGQLKVLKLWGCNNITDAGLVNLLQQEPLLKELCVGFWDSTDGSFFEALRELCPRLRHIHLWRCARIDLPAVKLFESRRPLVSVKLE